MPYKTAKGTNLTARVFTAIAPPGSRLAGKYTVTVVDYSNAKGEIAGAVEEARAAIKAKGTVKYDELNNVDLHLTRRLSVETPNSRLLAEILFAANNRLYITQAETALNVPPPAIFQPRCKSSTTMASASARAPRSAFRKAPSRRSAPAASSKNPTRSPAS
jgi:hypothetical protein